MNRNVLKRLKVLENQFETTAEEDGKVKELTELLRQYGECMVERRKLPVEEQKRLEKQETEEFLQWYREWHKTYDEWRRVNGDEHENRESWQAYIRWDDAWSLEWEKTNVKNHDNALIFAKTGGN